MRTSALPLVRGRGERSEGDGGVVDGLFWRGYTLGLPAERIMGFRLV